MKALEKRAQIRRTAAEVLASAVSDYDPKTFIIKGGASPISFYYDFIFVNPFQEETLPLIEERMRKIVADDMEIKIHEMVPMSAANFLRHHRRPYAAHFVEKCGAQLVKVLQFGNFVDHIHGSFLDSTGQIKAFKLIKMERRSNLIFRGEEKKVYRIIGVAEEDKEGLKAHVKKYKAWIGVNHLQVGEALGLFRYDVTRDEDHFERAHLFWTKEGEELFYQIHRYWRERLKKERYELVMTEGENLTKAHRKLMKLSKRSSEKEPVKYAEYCAPSRNQAIYVDSGLLPGKGCHKDQAHIFCTKKDLKEQIRGVTTLLHELPSRFGFRCDLEIQGSEEIVSLLEDGASHLGLSKRVSKGKEGLMEWKIHDDFGRTFTGPFLSVKEKNEIFTLSFSLFSSVERIIALILESYEKDLSQKKELFSRIGA
ncbi:MAG: hypothetical protein KDK63_04445 [Chlamydiia bacterium]|nr:hypothetical protein [Chlamydiia bacterium]